MMTQRKRVSATISTTAGTEAPSCFFEKQLQGEQSLTWATARTLWDLATALYELRPWELLADTNLILLADPVTGEMCHCCVMGALGEVFALHVYLGPESYRLFKRVSCGDLLDMGEFFASQHAVSVEFAAPSKMMPPDRELARSFGHAPGRGVKTPVFRAGRPGYFPWFVTENEAQTLAECHRAVLAFCKNFELSGNAKYWKKEDVYPFLSRPAEPGAGQEYQIEQVRVAEAPASPAELPALDVERIQRIRARNYPSHGVFEADDFYGNAMIGAKDERKACLRLGLVIDAASGFAFPPETESPSASSGDLLSRVLLAAVECAKALPQEVRVRDLRSKTCLGPLARELGFAVRVAPLPALEFAKSEMLRMMQQDGF